jgi:hypothetical protein
LISQKDRDEIIAAIDAKKMPPQKTKLGGEIYIHGGGTDSDWTWGCVALKKRRNRRAIRRDPGRNQGHDPALAPKSLPLSDIPV